MDINIDKIVCALTLSSISDVNVAIVGVCSCRPHKFKAVYSVSLHGEQLRTDFRVFNTCEEFCIVSLPLIFSLHCCTY